MTLTLLWLTSPWTLKVHVSSSSSMLVMPCTCLACWMLAPWVPMARPIKSSRTRNSSVYPDRILVLWGGKFHQVKSWPVKLPNSVTWYVSQCCRSENSNQNNNYLHCLSPKLLYLMVYNFFSPKHALDGPKIKIKIIFEIVLTSISNSK